MKTLICLTLLACHSPKAQMLPLLVAGQFDAATTYHDLKVCKTCYEVNPFLKPVAKTPAIFPVMALADSLTVRLARRAGMRHHIIKWVIIGGFTALHVWCGFHNIGFSVRQPGRNAGPG